MTIMLTGTPDEDALDRLGQNGHTVVRPERQAKGRQEIAQLIAWMCAHADALYMVPAWRTDTVACALRATAIAAGITLLGFE